MKWGSEDTYKDGTHTKKRHIRRGDTHGERKNTERESGDTHGVGTHTEMRYTQGGNTQGVGKWGQIRR